MYNFGNEQKVETMRLSFFLCVLILGFTACQSDAPEEKKPKDRSLPKNLKIDRKAGPIRTPDGTFLYYQLMGQGPAVIVPNGTYLSGDFRLLQDQFTLVFYDVRNRGRSQKVQSADKLKGGIQQDVEDLETVRKHFNMDKVHLIAHGYQGLIALAYAKKYPERVARIVQISAMSPAADRNDPVFEDSVNIAVRLALDQIESVQDTLSDLDYCNALWKEYRKLYTFVPGNEIRALSQICQYANEHPRHTKAHYEQYIKPSIEAMDMTEFKAVQQPTLILHGSKDRVHSLKGAKRWTKILPNAEFQQIEIAGYLTWMDAQSETFGAIRRFLKEEEITQ